MNTLDDDYIEDIYYDNIEDEDEIEIYDEDDETSESFLSYKNLDKDLQKMLEKDRSLYNFSYKGKTYKGKVLKKIDSSVYIFNVQESANESYALKKIDINYAIQK